MSGLEDMAGRRRVLFVCIDEAVQQSGSGAASAEARIGMAGHWAGRRMGSEQQ